MTLTEEQRAAIHAVSGLLTAIGCPQCHSYLQKNYTHHIEVLRAMTDSSEQFSDASKMIGFDLVARIRELEAENVQLLAALDESERVVAHKTKSAAHWYDEHLQARADRVQTRRVVEQQAARIKELEDALVEERGNKMIQTDDCTQNQEAADIHHRCICEYNVKKCPVGQWWLDRARVALQAEGKIGPDARPKCDHEWQAAIEERGYQTCLKCGECRDIKDIPRTAPTWQITEERVGLLEYCLESLLDAPDIDDYSEPRQSIRMLRAMLKEAL